MRNFSKKAAIEMSMGTIVVIVLSVTILIFGMIFIKNIMCSGIVLTDKVDENVANELKALFGTSDYGVKCMGQDNQEVTIGDGGRRRVTCVINTDTAYTYTLNIKNIESLGGVDSAIVQRWAVDRDWKGKVSPGQSTQTVLVLDIPRDVSSTTLKITLDEYVQETGSTQTHTMYLDVKHVSGLTSTIC